MPVLSVKSKLTQQRRVRVPLRNGSGGEYKKEGHEVSCHEEINSVDSIPMPMITGSVSHNLLKP